MRFFAVLVLLVGLLWSTKLDPALAAYYPGGTTCSSVKAISQTTSTDLVTFTNKAYICALMIVSATAQNVSLVQGTGTTCGTSTVALIGSTTAASGPALAANGGFEISIAPGAYIVSTTTAQHVCLLQSSTGLVAGVMIYADAP